VERDRIDVTSGWEAETGAAQFNVACCWSAAVCQFGGNCIINHVQMQLTHRILIPTFRNGFYPTEQGTPTGIKNGKSIYDRY